MAIPDAAPVSRILRLVLGLVLLAWMVPMVLAAGPGSQMRVAAVVVGLTIIYSVVHWVVSRHLQRLHPWLGALVAVGPVLVVAQVSPLAGAGAVLYLGLSLVLIAIRGEPGCEVLAVPAMLARRPTHLACLLFSPLDWMEHSLLGRRSPNDRDAVSRED